MAQDKIYLDPKGQEILDYFNDKSSDSEEAGDENQGVDAAEDNKQKVQPTPKKSNPVAPTPKKDVAPTPSKTPDLGQAFPSFDSSKPSNKDDQEKIYGELKNHVGIKLNEKENEDSPRKLPPVFDPKKYES